MKNGIFPEYMKNLEKIPPFLHAKMKELSIFMTPAEVSDAIYELYDIYFTERFIHHTFYEARRGDAGAKERKKRIDAKKTEEENKVGVEEQKRKDEELKRLMDEIRNSSK